MESLQSKGELGKDKNEDFGKSGMKNWRSDFTPYLDEEMILMGSYAVAPESPPKGFGQSAQASLPVRPGRTAKETLFEEFRKGLDAIDVVDSAACFPATVHGQDSITHIDTLYRNRRSKDVS